MQVVEIKQGRVSLYLAPQRRAQLIPIGSKIDFTKTKMEAKGFQCSMAYNKRYAGDDPAGGRDLALIKGPDFSRLFDLDIGRKRSIKDGTGKIIPENRINFTCEELKQLQNRLTVDDLQQNASDLRARIAAAFAAD